MVEVIVHIMTLWDLYLKCGESYDFCPVIIVAQTTIIGFVDNINITCFGKTKV